MMKKLIVITCLLLPVLLTGNSRSDYIKTMSAAIKMLFESTEIEEYVQVANTFERISLVEEDKWHPHYYLALTKAIMSTLVSESEKKDGMLDQAQTALDNAMAIYQTPHSELVAIQGFIHMLRIPIDASSRGPQYSGLAMKEISKSIELNPENPRAHYIMANMQMGTARFFGNDYTQACTSLEESLRLFKSQVDPKHPLDPLWGQDWAETLNGQCKESP